MMDDKKLQSLIEDADNGKARFGKKDVLFLIDYIKNQNAYQARDLEKIRTEYADMVEGMKKVTFLYQGVCKGLHGKRWDEVFRDVCKRLSENNSVIKDLETKNSVNLKRLNDAETVRVSSVALLAKLKEEIKTLTEFSDMKIRKAEKVVASAKNETDILKRLHEKEVEKLTRLNEDLKETNRDLQREKADLERQGGVYSNIQEVISLKGKVTRLQKEYEELLQSKTLVEQTQKKQEDLFAVIDSRHVEEIKKLEDRILELKDLLVVYGHHFDE